MLIEPRLSRLHQFLKIESNTEMKKEKKKEEEVELRMRICREEIRRERPQTREKKEMRRVEENKIRDEKQRLFIH